MLDKEPRVVAPSEVLLFHAPSSFLQTVRTVCAPRKTIAFRTGLLAL